MGTERRTGLEMGMMVKMERDTELEMLPVSRRWPSQPQRYEVSCYELSAIIHHSSSSPLLPYSRSATSPLIHPVPFLRLHPSPKNSHRLTASSPGC